MMGNYFEQLSALGQEIETEWERIVKRGICLKGMTRAMGNIHNLHR